MNASQDAPHVLLKHHLKALRLPVFLREHPKVAAQCATDKADYAAFLLRLSEQELLERERKGAERRIKAAKFPAPKTLDGFDFLAAPTVNKIQILELARCEWIDKRESLILLGNPGTGKTHVAVALGMAACQRGYNVRFFAAAALVNALLEARDEKSLLKLQARLAKAHLLVIDELGYVPFSKTAAELLFEIFSQRYERGSVLVTSNLPFEEWTSVFGSERLTGALLDRLTHRSHIVPIEGESYRLAQRKGRQAKTTGKSAPGKTHKPMEKKEETAKKTKPDVE
jgi:DNA replication protein DnaC